MDDITKKMCNQLHENYYGAGARIISGKFINEQESAEDSDETQDNTSSAKIFKPTDEIVKGYITALEGFVKTGLPETPQISYDDLFFYKETNRVTWSGAINNSIKWEFILMNNQNSRENNVYFTVDNQSLSISETSALNKMNIFLREKLKNEVENAVRNKSYEQTV